MIKIIPLSFESIHEIRSHGEVILPDEWMIPGTVTMFKGQEYQYIICNQPEKVEFSVGQLYPRQVVFHRFQASSYQEAFEIGQRHHFAPGYDIPLKSIDDSRLERLARIYVVLALTGKLEIIPS